MRRIALALVALGACSSPPAAHTADVRPQPETSTSLAPPAPTTTAEPTTTTTEAPSTTTSTTEPPAPSTTSSPPATVATRPTGAGGTTSASWYGDESGSHTANGDRYDPDGLTFAHRSLPFGTQVQFCRLGTCVVATCTDRGPAAWTGRDFDLSRGTFSRLAPLSAGVATVTWERVA